MAQNKSNDCCKASLVNSKIVAAICSCSHCDIMNAFEKRHDLTCSCEDCTDACLYYTFAKMQSNRPANPPTIKELRSLSQLRKKINQPTSSPTTPLANCGVMSARLLQQESIVGLQKRAYLPAAETKPEKECVLEKCTCMGDRVYEMMTATLQQQESIVGLQKRVYLPASETKPDKECVLEKCTCIGDRVYGMMTATLQQQKSIVALQKRAYLPDELESNPKNQSVLEKCTCIISDPFGNIKNRDMKESSNICCAGFVSEVSKVYHMQELPDYLNGDVGYVFDVPKICFDKQESSEVPKFCHKQESCKVPKFCHKQESSEVPEICYHKQESSEVPKFCHKQESSKVPTSCHKQESSEIPKICCHKQESSEVPKICNKQESPDLVKDAAGYVFNVPKICCNKHASLYYLNGGAGYVFDVPKTYKELCKKGQEIGNERQFCKVTKERYKKKTTNECNMYNESSSSETKKSQLGSKNNTQVFNINKLVSDSQQYKPTNNTQGLFKNILQIQENTLSGYVYELPKYSPTTQKKNYECRESVKNKSASQNISELSGCVTELQTCRTSPHEPANTTRKTGIDILKAKGIASDSKNTLIKKKSCKAPGYVWEVPKHSPKHYDHKKKKCDCNEFAKYKSDKPEYGLEQKNKINSCPLTEVAERKPKLPEFAYDVPICREIDNAERVWKNKNSCECKKTVESEPSAYAHELSKCTHKLPFHKNSCVCAETVKKKSASPENAQELTKCTHKPQSQKSSSECRESVSKAGIIPSELPGYVFVVPKRTQKSCTCTMSAKNYSKSSHGAANNAEEFTINRLGSKCIQPDTQNICKSIVGTQTNTTEVLEHSLDLPHPASKYTIDLCKDVLKNHSEAIEVLKNIYLPQKGKVVSTSCCCPFPLTEPSKTIKKYINAATQTETANGEFNDCLLCRQLNMSNKPRKISKSDIITRLKEAYKACSCKICECFASSKPVKTDASKHEYDKSLRSISLHETNEQPLFSCKPCDCVQCTKTLTEQCHCVPCQCGDCKTRNINQGQSFLVATVVTEENVSRVACTCSPCTCIECGLVCPFASSIVNEMSTSTNRLALCRCEICLNKNCDQSGFDSCKCQKHKKVTSKPVEQDTHEFDIRTVRIVHNTPVFQGLGRNDTLAMFADIPGRYPTFDDRISNTQTCTCKECECTFCVCQKDAIKSSQLFSSNTAKSRSDCNDRYNNCELKMPYECQLCQKIQSHDKCCVCDTCDCLNCEISNMPKNVHRFGRYRYSDAQYERCSFKKADVLTPSIHKLKVQNQILQKKHLEEPSCYKPKVTTNTDSTSKLRDIGIFDELTSTRKIGSIKQANLYMNDCNTRYIHRCKTFKCDAYMHYQKRNKKGSLHKNIAIDNEISGSCSADHSSSYYKRYGSNTLISPNKSRESSCNSSVYNYPEYFIQFPKGTEETSLKDVMKLDMDETIKLDKCNTTQNSTEKHNVDKISYGNENSCKINECNHFSNNKLIARPTESNNNISENAHIESMRRNCKNSLHVQLNNQNNKYKNFRNNGLQNEDRNVIQNSAWLTGSQSSLAMNNENREYMNAIHDFNEFHVARNVYYNNISEGNPTSARLLPIHEKRYTSQQTTHSDFDSGAEILNVYDYTRVRNTLMIAREFSLELITLLKTYEKANEEFESISEKLKLSHPI